MKLTLNGCQAYLSSLCGGLVVADLETIILQRLLNTLKFPLGKLVWEAEISFMAGVKNDRQRPKHLR